MPARTTEQGDLRALLARYRGALEQFEATRPDVVFAGRAPFLDLLDELVARVEGLESVVGAGRRAFERLESAVIEAGAQRSAATADAAPERGEGLSVRDALAMVLREFDDQLRGEAWCTETQWKALNAAKAVLS